MVTTTEILPALPLREYIRCYCLREIDTAEEDLVKPIHAIDFTTMTFWLSSTPVLYTTDRGAYTLNSNDRHLLGLQTSFCGYQTYSGRYRFLTVQFKGNGFYSIFKVPTSLLSNHLLHSDDVVGKQVSLLDEQLKEAGSIQAMCDVANTFFLNALLKSKKNKNTDVHLSINAAAQAILQQREALNIVALADEANMSLRGFEQHFTAQVGVAPKLFFRLVRFNKALQLKMTFPQQDWTIIAYRCGYFDQMHMIKDFKSFCGYAPHSFLQQLPPPQEDFLQKVT